MNSNKTQDQLLLGTLKNNDESGIIAYGSQILHDGSAGGGSMSLSTLVDILIENTDFISEALSISDADITFGNIEKDTIIYGNSLKYNEKTIATTDLIPDISTKLDKSEASNTYLTKSNAASTYATITTTGALSNLNTTNKSNLVSAVNEVKTLAENSSPSLNYYKEDATNKSFAFTVNNTDRINSSDSTLLLSANDNITLTTPSIQLDIDCKLYGALNNIIFGVDDTGSFGDLKFNSNKFTFTGDSLTFNGNSVATTKDLSSYYNKTSVDSLLTNKVDKVTGKQLSTNDYTSDEKTKLAGIAANANNYSLPTSSSSTLGGIKVGYATSNKNYAVQLDSSNNAYVNVPWQNTTYNVATTSTNGLMSSADKTKLDNISGMKILTQAEYDALTTKEEDVIYFIRYE